VRVATTAAFIVALRRRSVTLSTRVDRRLCRDLLRYVPVLGSIPIVNALYARADVFLLTWFGTWTEVGLYSAGLRLVDVTRSIPPAYARALYPILSRLHVRSVEEFAALARRSVRNILLLVVPIALLLSGLAQPVIVLLYGPNLAAGAASLRVLAWALVPMALATTLAQVLFSANKQAIDLRVNLMATVVSVGVGVLLVPRWGAVGAATAVVLSSGVYAALQYAGVRSNVAEMHALMIVGRVFVVAVTSSGLMMLLGGSNAIVVGSVGLAAYATGLALAGMITREDLDRVRLSLPRLSAAIR